MTFSPAKALSTFYFCWFCTVAINIAFAPIHCRLLGFTPYEIALVVISANIAILFAPPITLWLTHHWIPARSLIIVLCVMPLIFFIFLSKSTSLFGVFFCWLLITFGGSGATSLVETHTMKLAANGTLRFENVRLWGSIGFLLASIATGVLYDRYKVPGILAAGVFSCLLIALTPLLLRQYLLAVPEKHEKGASRHSELAPELDHDQTAKSYTIIRNSPALILLLLTSALQWASHSTLYVYFSLYLQDFGWNGSGISTAWNIAVLAEILLFLNFAKLQKRFLLEHIMLFSVFSGILRWGILFAWPTTTGIIIAQVFHAFSFGAFFLSTLKILYLLTPESFSTRIQGILAAVGPGLGSILGRIGIGSIAEALPHPIQMRLLFLPATILSVISFGFAISLARRIPIERSAIEDECEGRGVELEIEV